jgi:microcystin-dependent protein
VANWYLSEIRTFGFNYPPKGWAFCNGQTLSIQQNTALFSLLGTTYGGNGQTTFQLPNLQGRLAAHFGTQAGNTVQLGQQIGEVNHTLLATEMPAHTHFVQGTTTAGDLPSPAASTMAVAGTIYATSLGSAPVTLAPASVTTTGGSQAHSNQQPYLVLNVCIALVGIYPSRN